MYHAKVILTRKYILKVDDTVQSVATNVLKRGQQPDSEIKVKVHESEMICNN